MKAVTGSLVWHDGGFREELAVLIHDDRIAAVVPKMEIQTPQADDWGEVAIIPGTVNAHGHSFQSLLKGFADDRPFDSWRDDVLYPFSKRLDGEAIYWGAMFAFAEALLAGVTTTVDFFYLHDGGNDNAHQVIRAAKDAGIRLVLARTFYDLDAPTNAPARYRESVEDAAARTLELAGIYREDHLVSVQPAPHSLHAASLDTVRIALDLADELGVPCHLHLAEARYEREQTRLRYGDTPVRVLARERLLRPSLVAVHSVWLDDQELDLLAAARSGVVHCPGANAFLGDGIARVPEMLARGIRVGLGPDGGCANNRQSVFDEMRSASLLARARLWDGSSLDASTTFRLGTRGGADMLQLPAGEIARGRYADLVALDLNDLSLQPRATFDKQIVHSMQPSAIAKVMVGGDVVVDAGEPKHIDLAELRAQVNAITSEWKVP